MLGTFPLAGSACFPMLGLSVSNEAAAWCCCTWSPAHSTRTSAGSSSGIRTAPRALRMDAPVALRSKGRGDDVGVRERRARGAHGTLFAAHNVRVQVVLPRAPGHLGRARP